MSTAAAPAKPTFFVFRSTAERMESRSDFVRDSARRREPGAPARDLPREPPRRRCGPWYSFSPFPGEPGEPYAVVESLYPVTARKGAYGEPLAGVHTGRGEPVEMTPG
jgi:hypothetical protein